MVEDTLVFGAESGEVKTLHIDTQKVDLRYRLGMNIIRSLQFDLSIELPYAVFLE